MQSESANAKSIRTESHVLYKCPKFGGFLNNLTSVMISAFMEKILNQKKKKCILGKFSRFYDCK